MIHRAWKPGAARAVHGHVRVRRARSDKITGSMPQQAPALSLSFGLRFQDLYERDGLQQLDQRSLDFVRDADSALHERLVAARAAPGALPYRDEAEVLLAVAPSVDRFVAQLFRIEAEWEELAAS